MRKIIMSLVAFGFLTAPMLMLQGCGDTKGDANYTEVTSIDSGGGDVTINDVQVSEEGTYIYNENGTVTFTTGDENVIQPANGDSDGDGVVDVTVGDYDEGYDASQCNAAGFFYCTIENKCLNQPSDAGTCTSR